MISSVSDSALQNAAIPGGFFVRPIYETGLSLRGEFISAKANMIFDKQCFLCVVLLLWLPQYIHCFVGACPSTFSFLHLLQERYGWIQNIVIPLSSSSFQDFVKMHAEKNWFLVFLPQISVVWISTIKTQFIKLLKVSFIKRIWARKVVKAPLFTVSWTQ